MVELSEQSTSWKIILEPMTGNLAISEVDALMCVVLSTVDKHIQLNEQHVSTAVLLYYIKSDYMF